MNTPRTKPPIRHKFPKFTAPDGGYQSGINDTTFALRIGELATYWPHVEERMVILFRELTGIADSETARQIFRTIVNQEIRIKIMRNML